VTASVVDAGTDAADRREDDVTLLGDRARVDKCWIDEPRLLVAFPGFVDIGGQPDRQSLLAEGVGLHARWSQKLRLPKLD